MAMKEENPETLSGEEALALAKKGKDVWNAWAHDNPGAEVDFSDADFTADPISFEGFVFPGIVSFRNAVLKNTKFSGAEFSGGKANFNRAKFIGGNAYFNGAKFSGGDTHFVLAEFSAGNANFREAEFSGGKAYFNGAKFSGGDANFSGAAFSGGDADFREVEFSGGPAYFWKAIFSGGCADFAGGKFDFPVYLKGARFTQVPDFRHTKLAAHFTLHDVRISFWDDADRKFSFLKQAKKPDDADKLRRLKELAFNAKDHEREQYFFASELRAKRFHETKVASLLWSYLYEWCSDFGRSTLRPIILLFLTWGAFGWGYWQLADGPGKSFADGLRFSAATMLPFVAASRTALSEARKDLFVSEAGVWVDALAFIEGFIGLAIIFLIGLALRNRFRI